MPEKREEFERRAGPPVEEEDWRGGGVGREEGEEVDVDLMVGVGERDTGNEVGEGVDLSLARSPSQVSRAFRNLRRGRLLYQLNSVSQTRWASTSHARRRPSVRLPSGSAFS